jgi:hypothetical protein
LRISRSNGRIVTRNTVLLDRTFQPGDQLGTDGQGDALTHLLDQGMRAQSLFEAGQDGEEVLSVSGRALAATS